MIRVTRLYLKKDVPSRITIEMDAATAAKLAYLLGKLSPMTVAERAPGTQNAYADLYDAFSMVFNAFYDEGVEQAYRETK